MKLLKQIILFDEQSPWIKQDNHQVIKSYKTDLKLNSC